MIQINDMNFAYKKGQDLFKNLGLDIDKSRICGLLGKNGAGKSTLLKLISGVLFADGGKIIVNGQNVMNRRVSFLEELYFLQEDFELPNISIEEYLDTYGGFYPSFDRERFKNMLLEFEIPFEKNIKNLSFGQKKKMHVSFALATQVKLLILDEPTNGMDIPSKSKFRSIVSKNLGEDQLVIISTHQIRDLGQLLDNIVIIQEGRVLINENLYDLSCRYSCEFVSGQHIPEGCIYSESAPGGHMILTDNKTNSPSDLDIEVLFNAITSNKDLFTTKSIQNGN